jgi:hypothetical protein
VAAVASDLLFQCFVELRSVAESSDLWRRAAICGGDPRSVAAASRFLLSRGQKNQREGGDVVAVAVGEERGRRRCGSAGGWRGEGEDEVWRRRLKRRRGGSFSLLC